MKIDKKKSKKKQPKKPVKLGTGDVYVLRSTSATYKRFRERWWARQSLDGVDTHASTRDGKKLGSNDIILQPKKTLFMRDLWICGTAADARYLLSQLMLYKHITEVSFKGSWVYVSYLRSKEDEDHMLPGQEGDDRETVTG